MNAQAKKLSRTAVRSAGFFMLLVWFLIPARLPAQSCFPTLQAAQNHPETNLSYNLAIEWANCITSQMPPPALTQQIIELGTFDVGAGTMYWEFPPPPIHVVPCFIRGPNGPIPAPCPPAPPAPDIQSFNVSYQIILSNLPVGYDLQAVLTNPTVGGGSEDIVGTIQNSAGLKSLPHAATQQSLSPSTTQQNLSQGGTVIAIPFHPQILAEQTLRFLHSGTLLNNCTGETGQDTSHQSPCSYKIYPFFEPQLGSFVAHYLPVAVIYQPPGSMSHGGFTTGTTYGTTFCWGTSTTAGTIQTQDTSAFFNTVDSESVANGIAKVASVAENLPGPVGTAAKVIGGVLSTLDSAFHINTTTTTSRQKGQTACKGANLTVTQEYDSDPVRGDRYVLLENALFVYVVVLIDPASGLIVPTNGTPTVILTMVSSTPNAPFMDDLLNPQNQYPAELVGEFQALDLQLDPQRLSQAIFGVQQPKPKTVNQHMGISAFPPAPRRVVGPLTGWDPLCYAEPGSDNKIGLGSNNYTSTDTSSATITTTTTKVSGFLASYVGATSDTTQSLTISSNQTAWSSYGTESLLDLYCPEINPPYLSWEMSYYLDPLFGTLLAVPGQKCMSTLGCGPPNTPMIAGTVLDQKGRPLPNNVVVLKIGGKIYRVFTHANGKFTFHTPPLPKGSGTIIVGNEAFSLAYNGAPVSNLNLRMGSGVAAASSLGRSTGASNLGNTIKPSLPCCPITSIDAAHGVATARVNSTGQSFQFAVKDAALLHSLKVGQGIFANFKTRQVSVNGKDVCCQIVSLATAKPEAIPATTGSAPTIQNPSGQSRSSGPCCPITAINQQTGIVTAKVSATGQTFEFKVTDVALLRTLKVGQAIFANFANKQVSLDGKTICCAIIAVGSIPSRSADAASPRRR